MARSYSVRLVALTLEVQTKWLDNLLSHFEITGASRIRQGIAREISHEALVRIEVIRSLSSELGVPLAKAVDIAAQINPAELTERVIHSLPSGYGVSIPIAAIERRLRERVLEAVESVAHVRRGRPKRR